MKPEVKLGFNVTDILKKQAYRKTKEMPLFRVGVITRYMVFKAKSVTQGIMDGH